MNSFHPTRRRLISGLVAVTAVVTANLLAAEAEITAAADATVGDTSDAAVEYALTPAPAPITGITGPELSGLSDLDDVKFVVPVLSRTKLELPDPPKVDVTSIRAEAAAWLGDGALPAPAGRLEVQAPDVSVDDAFDAPAIEVPTLQRPELAPPPVR